MSQPSVLLVDLARYYGGADVRVLLLARTFEQTGVRYGVATLQGSDLQRRLQSEGLHAHAVPYSRGDWRNIPFLRALIREQDYRVIDAHNPQSQLWAHLATVGLRGVRRISTMHSSYRLEHGGSAKGYAYEQVIRLNQLLGCRFIAVSEAVTRYLQDTVHLPQDRVQMIPNSISIPPMAHSRTHALYQQLGWNDSHHKLIVVGRLEEVKGHRYLIDALHQVAADHPALRCLFVGEGRCKEALLAQVEAAGLQQIVHFSGFRDDVDALLAASDLFVMPSLSEGLPYALLEACAYRLPVLVSAVGGMAQLLTDRHNALLVPPADVDALAQGLRWMLAHPAEAQQLAATAYALIEREYGLQTMIDRTLALYQS